MNPTPSDIAAAKELSAAVKVKGYLLVGFAQNCISRHMQPERELLLEVAKEECKTPLAMWRQFKGDMQCDEPKIIDCARCLPCRARQWKMEQGL